MRIGTTPCGPAAENVMVGRPPNRGLKLDDVITGREKAGPRYEQRSPQSQSPDSTGGGDRLGKPTLRIHDLLERLQQSPSKRPGIQPRTAKFTLRLRSRCGSQGR